MILANDCVCGEGEGKIASLLMLILEGLWLLAYLWTAVRKERSCDSNQL